MKTTEGPGSTSDPFELWRQLYDANERAWSAALEQAMGSREFGESSGKLLETMLAAQKSVRDNMRTYLESMNVPTREDIARLGELVVGLEEKIDQGTDRLDSIEAAVGDGQRAFAETIKSMNVPTREAVAQLGELVVRLEKKIDRRHALEDAARARAAASAKAAAGRAKVAADRARAAEKAKAAEAKAKAAAAKTTGAKPAGAKTTGAKPAGSMAAGAAASK